MAKGASIYKADLQIADMDRNYYENHSLTLACHPSETEERMMVRLLAFVLYAHESLEFGRGISTQDEPDLWQKDLTGSIDLWIEVGQREERDLRRACGRAKQVVVVCYGGRGVNVWWTQNSEALDQLKNLTVINLPLPATQGLARIANRNMQLQCNIQDAQISIIADSEMVQIEPVILLSPAA
ncbi:MAG: YaeQ family protein [Spirochaetia bacterium]|nr:YaeQ family protein [Spirochaetia bacterium]